MRWKLYILLFCCAFSFFALVMPMGHLPSDTRYSIETARSLITRGSLAIEPAESFPYLVSGTGGKYYSKYGPGYALLFVPPLAAAHLLSVTGLVDEKLIEKGILSFTNTIIASIIACLFFSLFVSMGYGSSSSLLTVAMIACGSLLLPYSKIIHAELPTVLLLLTILRILVVRAPGLPAGCISGIALAGLIWIKPANAVYAFIFGLALLYRWYSIRKPIGFLIAILTSATIPILLLLLLNIVRFGSMTNLGYGHEQREFTTPFIEGFAGLLFSPSKSLILFSPLLIGACIGARQFQKKHGLIFSTILVTFIAGVLFYAKWHDWHGGWAWGPRLIVPPILLLHVFLAECTHMAIQKKSYRLLLIILTVAGLAVNSLGALVWYQQIYYFHSNYHRLQYSHVHIAAKLLTHKLKGREEVYRCSDFSRDCSSPEFRANWGAIVSDTTIDLRGFETYQGIAVPWHGLAIHYGYGWAKAIPLALLALIVILTRRILKYLRTMHPTPG
jgi:hypothetical protein